MKKLWQRGKSRVRGGHREQETTGTTDRSVSKNKATLNSAQPPPPVPERSARRTASPAFAPRPGSSNRTQPVLIGISRPSATFSRPGTAGSLQNAVNQAADKVARTVESDPHRGHTRTKSPRYVDIFDIQKRSSKSSYNEDVAERNIDLKKVAEEGEQYRYVPGSKFQEEVASRNAHARTNSDPFNYENLPPRQEVLRSPTTMGPGYYIPPDRIADADDIRRLHHAQLEAMRQSRPSTGSNPAPQLTGASLPVAQPALAGQSQMASQGQAPRNVQEPFGTTQSSNFSSNAKSSPELRRQAPERTQSDETGPPLQPLTTSSLNAIASPLPGYQVSQSEVLRREADSPDPNWVTDMIRETARPAEYSARSLSPGSTHSAVRKAINLQHRTIMDLTGEDEEVFSNGYPESDMSKSPVLEQAHENRFQRAQPEVVPTKVDLEKIMPDGTVSQQKQAEKATTSAPSDQQTEQPPEVPPPSSFSSINTIVSVSPTIRLNGEPVPLPELTLSPPSKPGRQVRATKLDPVAETEPETDDFETPAEDPPQPVFTPLPIGSAGTSKISEPAASADETPVGQPQSSPAPVETPKQPETAESTPKNIQMSPESLQSRDFIEPSRAFGVQARDFAATPTRPVHNVRPDREPNTSAKVTQSRSLVVNGDTNRPVQNFIPSSTAAPASPAFDEEKFRRKQEQARAALVKLQQSLNEEFIAPPKTVRTARGRNANTRPLSNSSNTSNDGRPVNPSSIFSQVREQHATRSQANGNMYPPRGSSQTFISASDRLSSSNRPASSVSTATVRPIHRQRSPSSQKERELDSALGEMKRLAEEMRNPRLVPQPQSQSSAPLQLNSNRNSNSTTSTSHSDVLPSPGEISLSSFPPPASVQHSRDTSLNLPIQHPPDATPPDIVRHQPPAPQQNPALPTSMNTQTLSPLPMSSQTQTQPPETVQGEGQQTQKQQAQPQAHSQVTQSPPKRTVLSRRGSTQSQTSVMSSSSQFSIPFAMIPERGSSMRDSLVREVDGED